MNERLLVGVLGHKNAGKSMTWKTLFEGKVKTTKRERQLWLSKTDWVKVFLVNGSPEERGKDVSDIIGSNNPRIVLCSMQYRSDVSKTINYFITKKYHLFIHWLNPGFSDDTKSEDYLNLIPYIHQLDYTLEVRDGKVNPTSHVNEIRDFIRGWATARSLLNIASPK
jgi:hypothetical protein